TGEKPASQGQGQAQAQPPQQQQPTAEQLEELRRQQELAMWQAEMARMYQRTLPVPQRNALGTFVGIGPLGPQYTIGGGDTVWIQTPNGLMPAHQLPQMVNPNVMWIVP
ncbi:MAG: hypothetical protein QHJ73_13600, partial [Armatimonadota bacterium]|nr:hypothetical protein [Armatimonadota bacterium]